MMLFIALKAFEFQKMRMIEYFHGEKANEAAYICHGILIFPLKLESAYFVINFIKVVFFVEVSFPYPLQLNPNVLNC